MKKLIVFMFMAIFAFTVGMAGVARAAEFYNTAPAARNYPAFDFSLIGSWGGGINQDHGIRISAPKHTFDTNTSLFSVRGNTGLGAGDNDTYLFTITDWGNVGIGTSIPAATLDVVGETITDELTLTLAGTPATSDTVLLITATGKVVDSGVSLSQITGGLQAQIDALQAVINDLPPGLRNIDRN